MSERDRSRQRSLVERMIGALAVGAATIAAVASPGVASAETCANPRPGLSASLPDCRSYEQVSPTEKGGYDAVPLSSLQYPAQASPSGEGVAYMGTGPFAGALGSGVPDARVSTRSPNGWRTTDLTPPTPSATPAGGWVLGYDFSEDLSQMVVKVPQQALVKLPAPGMEGLYNLFLRGADGSYSLVNSASPSALPPPTCVEACLQRFDVPAFAGASSDFAHLLFEADDSLEGTGAPVGPFGNLYEQIGGKLHLVGLLPDGEIAQGGATAGAGGKLVGGATYSSVARTAWRDVNHAISADGTHVLFEAAADGGLPDKAQKEMVEVYDRIGGGSTVEISAPAAGATPANAHAEPAQFWAASVDGSSVLFASSAELTSASKTGLKNNSQDLYRYETNGDSHSLTDLTVDGNPTDKTTGAGVQGVVGASSDGSDVYFVATGQLIAHKGVDGQPNLYASHEDGSTHERHLGFIATLAPAVVNSEGEEEPGDSKSWTATPAEQQVYVTPDGRHLAFMSLNSLTGYDNIDHVTGKPDYEVYEYNADSGTLTCASCDPSGAQPVGSAFIGATLTHPASTPFHQPRVLSDDGGRLFFSSPDPLIAGAASSRANVYEYERGGVGGCSAEGGCLYRISGELGEADDVFLDASATGNDVFFATLSRLSSTDQDNLVDVYDARVSGGFPPQVVPAGCTSPCPGTTPAWLPPPSLVSDVVGASGNLPPPSSSKGKSPPRVSCQSKARRIKNAKARARALKRCPKARSRKASHGTARGSGKKPRSRR